MSAAGPLGMECLISGRVQGVGYRAFVRRFAVGLGIRGRAINLSDGRVLVWAFADAEKLERLLNQLHVGPPLAKVSHVERRDLDRAPGEIQVSDEIQLGAFEIG